MACPTVAVLILVLFPIAMIWIGFKDLMVLKITNGMVVAIAAGFAISAVIAGLDPLSVGITVLSAFGVMAVGFALFTLGMVGGGDAKLAAALTLWVSPALLPEFFLVTAMVGAVLALILLLVKRLRPVSPDTSRRVPQSVKESRVPYGIALAGGALWCFPTSPIGLWALSACSGPILQGG